MMATRWSPIRGLSVKGRKVPSRVTCAAAPRGAESAGISSASAARTGKQGATSDDSNASVRTVFIIDGAVPQTITRHGMPPEAESGDGVVRRGSLGLQPAAQFGLTAPSTRDYSGFLVATALKCRAASGRPPLHHRS